MKVLRQRNPRIFLKIGGVKLMMVPQSIVPSDQVEKPFDSELKFSLFILFLFICELKLKHDAYKVNVKQWNII